MKRLLPFFLAVVMLISTCTGAFALNFTGELGNESTFETLQEAHASSPAVVKGIIENGSKTFVGHPALEGYPEGTTYVYRSANQYAGRAAARLNTNIFLYVEQHFADKDEAFAYLQSTGLIDIIEQAVGSIVLVTPVGETFAREDADSYYALQTAMLAQRIPASTPRATPSITPTRSTSAATATSTLSASTAAPPSLTTTSPPKSILRAASPALCSSAAKCRKFVGPPSSFPCTWSTPTKMFWTSTLRQTASTPCAPRATSSPITIRPGRCARSSSATWTPWTPPR